MRWYVTTSTLVGTMTPESTRLCTLLGSLTLSLLAFGAQAVHAQSQVYTVDIRPTLNDLDVKIEYVANARVLTVNLTNHSPTRVRCSLHYNAPPQTPLRATRNINPGQTGSSVLRAQRRWFTVTVDVDCVAAPA